IGATVGLELVCDDSQQRRTRASKRLMQSFCDIATVTAYTADDDHAVYLTQQREGVGDSGQGRRVDHYQVICGLNAFEQHLHGMALYQLAWVRRRRSTCDEHVERATARSIIRQPSQGD